MEQTIIDSQNKRPSAYSEAMRRLIDLGYFIQSFTLSRGTGVIVVNGKETVSQEHQKEIYQIIDDVSDQERRNRNRLL